MTLKAVAITGGGGGGGVSGGGTPGTIPIWNGATSLTNSPLSFSGATLSSSAAMTGINFSAAAGGQTWTLPNNGFALTIQGTSGNGTLKLDTNNRYVGVDSPSTPADKLHIAESGPLAFRMQNVTAATYWQHKVDGSGNWGLAVNGGANTVTALAASGNVGIGTASPVTTLHVARNGTTDPAIIGSGTNSAVGNFESSDFGRANRWTFGRDNSLTGNFVVAYNGSTLTSTTSGGNVGIGNAAPSTKLHVGSATTAASTLVRVQTQGGADQVPVFSLFRSGVSETALWTPVTATGAVGFAMNPAGYTDAQLTTATKVNITVAGAVQATGTTASTPAFSSFGDTDTGMYFPAANQLRFSTGGTQAMNLDASQNLQFNSGYGSVATAYGTRAWVNFDGTSAGTFAGGASTVTRAAGSTTATVTTTSAHSLITGNVVAALTGVAAGVYVVTVTNSTTFTITTAATTALTAVPITFDVRTIRASGNVSSIARASTGLYYVNFAVAFPDANYAAKPSSASPQTFVLKAADGGANPTATACTVYTTGSTGTAVDEPYVFFSVVR